MTVIRYKQKNITPPRPREFWIPRIVILPINLCMSMTGFIKGEEKVLPFPCSIINLHPGRTRNHARNFIICICAGGNTGDKGPLPRKVHARRDSGSGASKVKHK
jgi:hypothetical protein